MSNPLTAYWIESPEVETPFGYGVTAFSKDDALALVRSRGLRLPADAAQIHITENIRVADLDASHVVPNIGPIVVRGVWFPFIGVGV